MPQPFLAFVIFQIESHIFARASLGPWSSYLSLPHSWNYRCISTSGSLAEIQFSLTFFRAGLKTQHPWAAGIIEVYHDIPP
jgi:hypothetical protein